MRARRALFCGKGETLLADDETGVYLCFPGDLNNPKELTRKAEEIAEEPLIFEGAQMCTTHKKGQVHAMFKKKEV